MTTSIRLPDKLTKRLDFLSMQTGRSKAFYIREMIEQSMPKMEELYLSHKVFLKISSGEESTLYKGDKK